MTQKKHKGIWVVAEQQDGQISPVSLELLSKARELQRESSDREAVTAVILGCNLDDAPRKLAAAGAQHIIVVDAPQLQHYNVDAHAAILSELAGEHQPNIILLGATATGSDLAPTLGAKLWTGVAAHCTDLRCDENGALIAVVPAFGGKVLGDIICPSCRPQMATVRPGILNAPLCFPDARYTHESYDPGEVLRRLPRRIECLGIKPQLQQGVPLESAEIVIAGGFGIESETVWMQLEELASLLGGAVGCTRPPLDSGWAEESQMIGTSGKSIRPKVYIGVGISGATHHLCGMKDSGLIISINNDEKAPIFSVSDIRIQADASVMLPALLAELRRASSDETCALS